SGPHEPTLAEKWTSPPKPYTEATLLRAMETAGKFVDNDELRDALKENGIGRPSTRAAIIETLFKREYIRKERKNLIATTTGVDLILTIQEELLKSAELTGLWERKLRQIEKGEYEARAFLDELKEMVRTIVLNVKTDNRTLGQVMAQPVVQPAQEVCPLCGKGIILKGKTAYGCSEWKAGCNFRRPLEE
ncbi:MAG: DNA topoisomerase, partial [Paludibacter sp.]|nr:DNA topoisomerase [Paludibacter sp.]